ncbi:MULTISPECIES: hypothetical protein [Stenotrophomonas]|uniref:Uncharacterized protein n=1 Tax=Stenotrophomonas lactitubi TaxID=2045214 RepID=A0AAW4GLG0_9GAMM|nr:MULTISPECIES: hypothetical protein [Stenotrophomonas]MBM9915429.1 hypothetical protein [Stenotrophomonas lactitubi]MBM9923485.1 hypothetical protein [Stenotrophomonas lactitubi]MBM9937181.1 hypothetical protein [Stenotrophomonas lactitubi]
MILRKIYLYLNPDEHWGDLISDLGFPLDTAFGFKPDISAIIWNATSRSSGSERLASTRSVFKGQSWKPQRGPYKGPMPLFRAFHFTPTCMNRLMTTAGMSFTSP